MPRVCCDTSGMYDSLVIRTDPLSYASLIITTTCAKVSAVGEGAPFGAPQQYRTANILEYSFYNGHYPLSSETHNAKHLSLRWIVF